MHMKETGMSKDLLSLGPGGGSHVEAVKAHSHGLRGQLAGELASDEPSFSDDQSHLLKFHGSYQQDDRDVRQVRKVEDADRDWQFMVRCRIPAGQLSAHQYLALDQLAREHANGTLRITTRQGIQFHGVLKRHLQATLQHVNATLLTTLAACGDVARNVMSCPVRNSDLAEAVAERLVPRTTSYHDVWLEGEKLHSEVEPVYGPTYLPRKFKIAVATPEDNCVDVMTQDVGLIRDGAGYTVVVGGGMGMTHGKTTTYPRLATPLAWVPDAFAVPLVEAVMLAYRDYGDRTNRKHARLKYLVAEHGIEWFLGEVESRLGRSLSPPRRIRLGAVEDHLGWQSQADGRWRLGLSIPSGRIQDADDVRLASGLRQAIEQFEPDLCLTPQQNVLLTNVRTLDRHPLDNLLQRFGIPTDPSTLGLARHALACPALPTCGQALSEAERVLSVVVAQVEAELAAVGLASEAVSVRVTGCPNGCARPYVGDVGVVGVSKDCYNLYLGGDRVGSRLNRLFAEHVALADIGATLHPWIHRWSSDRQGGEGFGDFVARTWNEVPAHA
jgi:sulfite reductase (ferredoxin)